jgi:hypothetical protein
VRKREKKTRKIYIISTFGIFRRSCIYTKINLPRHFGILLMVMIEMKINKIMIFASE